MKICSLCGETKEAFEFSPSRQTKDKLKSRCKKCNCIERKQQDKNFRKLTPEIAKAKDREKREKSVLVNLLIRAKYRAKNRGIEFSINKSDIIIPEICPVLGIKLCVAKYKTYKSDNSFTLDRIDNSKGYIKGNVIVISGRANRIKADANPEELIKIGKFYANLLVRTP